MKPFPNNYLRYGASVAGVVAIALVLGQFGSRINPTTAALALLLVILTTATFFGRNPALLTSFVAMICFNYFFLEPFYTWHIADPGNLVAWGTFTLTAIIAGELSASARRRAEEAEAGRREIERLYRELHEAFEKASQAEALRQSEKLKSSLLDAVTHDLRTPLTSIKASVTALLDDRADHVLDEEGEEEFLEIINEETDRLNEFIESIVGIAKVEAGALHLRKNRTNVEEIVGAAAERAEKLLASKRVVYDLEPDLPPVLVDAASVSEVVYTLLDNAAKYSPRGSQIRVAARRAGEAAIELAVEDQGRGIAPGLREKVFDKFFRVTETDAHTTGSGLGLGLAIARGIIESQGGRIRIEDGSPGYRTRVALNIPLDYEREKILVVDDELQITRVLRRSLAAHGCEVRTASNGISALESFYDFRPDLVITDLSMPEMDGITVCREIRKTSATPIIVLSVKGEEQTKVEALDAGADDYITKPFGMNELLARVRATLRRAPEEEKVESALEVGDFAINLLTHRVFVRGAEIHLTPKEFELLTYLVRHHDKILTHRVLLAAVWGGNYTEQTEYLRVFLGNLRRKIELNPAKPQHILTEPWVGYRFVASVG